MLAGQMIDCIRTLRVLVDGLDFQVSGTSLQLKTLGRTVH